MKAALARYDTDSAAVDKVDSNQIEIEEKAILQPYVDRYEGGMKAAGFRLT